METLPEEICHRIFFLLDHQNLAAAQQVCRNWKDLAIQDELWRNLFIKRWGADQANFYRPLHPKTWKMTYETQDRRDRVGLGWTITCEGCDYYIVYQGEIQHWLCSKKIKKLNHGKPDFETEDRSISTTNDSSTIQSEITETLPVEKGPCPGVFDKMLFFVGDLERASRQVKRSRIL
uniref:F-box domain-containing protein n=1 Tax=Araucaria cunninghamii TaxID=56994 RepID=A0A0D6QT45_ARACU